MEVEARGATVLFRALPLRPRRAAGRRRGAGPRRHRGEAPRPGAAQQGRDHPGDPPPGEEQPADRRRAAAPAGAAHGRRGGAAWRSASRCAGSPRSRSVHETLSMSVDEGVDLDEIVDRLVPMISDVATVQHARSRSAGRAASASSPPSGRRRWSWCSPNSCRTPWSTPSTPGSAGTVTIRAERSARWLDVVIHDDGSGLPAGFSLERSDRLGLQIVRTLVDRRTGRFHRPAPRDGRRHRRRAARAAGPPWRSRLTLTVRAQMRAQGARVCAHKTARHFAVPGPSYF